MNLFLLNPKEIYLKYDSLLDELCKPRSKYTKDKVQKEFHHRRNKMIVNIHIFLIISFIIDIMINQGPLLSNFFRIFLVLITICVMFASCRYHPQIFKVFYTCVCVIYGPTLVDTGEEGIHTAFLGAQNLPVFVYLFTGSFWHFLFQIGVQLIYVNRLYYTLLEKAVVYMTPPDFTGALVYSSNLSVMFCCTLVMLTHYSMNQAYCHIASSEKKKDEFEKQKTFLLGFSHELRNLINSLTGNVKIASLENLSSRAKELLLNAEVCGELLLHLVNNILDTGKTEIGELEINPVPTKIYDTLERVWGICSELIRRKKLTGFLKIQRDIPQTLVLDHYRLTQIFLNLVGNAIKFTDKGTISVSVEWIKDLDKIDEKCFQPYPFNDNDEHDEGIFESQQNLSFFDSNLITLTTTNRVVKKDKLEPSYTTNKGVLKVIIRDSGCGMEKEDTYKLFQKFSQVTSDPSKKKLGTGLGLFITKELCQKMNGHIQPFSKKDKGSSFIFCIPMACVPEEKNHIHNLAHIKTALAPKKLKVLIVDDAPLTQDILQEFWNNLGMQVSDIAMNGLEAYEKYIQSMAQDNRPNIITMDLDMPIMDGKTASRKIREFEVEKGLDPCFLLIVSGNCTDSEIKECLDPKGGIRANSFLKKPFVMEDFVRVIGSNMLNF